MEEIFDFLHKEKFITFPQDHKLPNKDELSGKVYYNIITLGIVTLILVGVS